MMQLLSNIIWAKHVMKVIMGVPFCTNNENYNFFTIFAAPSILLYNYKGQLVMCQYPGSFMALQLSIFIIWLTWFRLLVWWILMLKLHMNIFLLLFCVFIFVCRHFSPFEEFILLHNLIP
jgi:hypothetical protein